MAILAGASLDASDFDLPDDVVDTAGGDGTNTISATSWAVLPTNALSVSIDNPHPELALVVDVHYSAWMKGSGVSSGGVRAGIAVSGAQTISPGVGAGGAEGWGEILYNGNAYSINCAGMFTVTIQPDSDSTTTFTMQAYKDASASSPQVNYAVIRLRPRRYVEAS